MFFFFNDTATTEIYTLSLHDALPIVRAFRGGMERRALRRRTRAARPAHRGGPRPPAPGPDDRPAARLNAARTRSEEHTSELQSRQYLVCRLLLEKKKNL